MQVLEKQFTARIVSAGRITIPEEIREVLKVGEGDLVDVKVSKPVKEVE